MEEIAHANLILPNNANGTFYFRNVKIFKYTKTQFCFSLPIYGVTFLQWGHKGLRHWVLGWRNCPVSSTDLNCSAICRNERHRNYCFEPNRCRAVSSPGWGVYNQGPQSEKLPFTTTMRRKFYTKRVKNLWNSFPKRDKQPTYLSKTSIYF